MNRRWSNFYCWDVKRRMGELLIMDVAWRWDIAWPPIGWVVSLVLVVLASSPVFAPRLALEARDVCCSVSFINPESYFVWSHGSSYGSELACGSFHNLIPRRFVQSGPLCVAPCIETFIQMGGQWILTSDQTRHNCEIVKKLGLCVVGVFREVQPPPMIFLLLKT